MKERLSHGSLMCVFVGLAGTIRKLVVIVIVVCSSISNAQSMVA